MVLKTYLAILLGVMVSSVAIATQAATNFTCTVSAIPQHREFKQLYTVHGDQNPLQVTYDFQGEKEQTHYFNLVTEGFLIKGLVPSADVQKYSLRIKFKRVSPPKEFELPDGVRIELNSYPRDTYAGLGMRDDYTTYVQDVTGDLEDGTKILFVLVCSR